MLVLAYLSSSLIHLIHRCLPDQVHGIKRPRREEGRFATDWVGGAEWVSPRAAGLARSAAYAQRLQLFGPRTMNDSTLWCRASWACLMPHAWWVLLHASEGTLRCSSWRSPMKVPLCRTRHKRARGLGERNLYQHPTGHQLRAPTGPQDAAPGCNPSHPVLHMRSRLPALARLQDVTTGVFGFLPQADMVSGDRKNRACRACRLFIFTVQMDVPCRKTSMDPENHGFCGGNTIFQCQDPCSRSQLNCNQCSIFFA